VVIGLPFFALAISVPPLSRRCGARCSDTEEEVHRLERFPVSGGDTHSGAALVSSK